MEPEGPHFITYRRPLLDASGQTVLGPGGGVEWGPPSTLRVEGTWLVLEQAGTLRRVADLGNFYQSSGCGCTARFVGY